MSLLLIMWAWSFCSSASAASRYVWTNSPAPAEPYDSWTNAAHDIQTAINGSLHGDTIVVTDGVYSAGTGIAEGDFARVAATWLLKIKSVNGPSFTIIDATPTSGPASTRGVYLNEGALLEGFTVKNGYAAFGGGVYCEGYLSTVSNCVVVSNSSFHGGAGVYGGFVIQSTIEHNSAPSGEGGGGRLSWFYLCTIRSNFSQHGGGMVYGRAFACTIEDNVATSYGGGAADSSLIECVIRSNRSFMGAGVKSCTVTNSTILQNRKWGALPSGYYVGAAETSRLIGCLVVSNHSGAAIEGGYAENCLVSWNTGILAVSHGVIVNCTISENPVTAPAMYNTRAYNSIIYDNSGNANQWDTNTGSILVHAYTNCCIYPLPPGDGNFTNAPLFEDAAAGNFRLLPGSPCINAGWNAHTTNTVDRDGSPRVVGGVIDVGAYERQDATTDRDGDLMTDLWEMNNFRNLWTAGEGTDADADGFSDASELVAGTQPTNAVSNLRLMDAQRDEAGDLLLQWSSVTGRVYAVLSVDPLTGISSVLSSNITATPPVNSLLQNPQGIDSRHLGIGVHSP